MWLGITYWDFVQSVWARTTVLLWGYGHIRFFRQPVSSRTAFALWRSCAHPPPSPSFPPSLARFLYLDQRCTVCSLKIVAYITSHSAHTHIWKTLSHFYIKNSPFSGCLYPQWLWQKVWKPSEKVNGGMKNHHFSAKGVWKPLAF